MQFKSSSPASGSLLDEEMDKYFDTFVISDAFKSNRNYTEDHRASNAKFLNNEALDWITFAWSHIDSADGRSSVVKLLDGNVNT